MISTPLRNIILSALVASSVALGACAEEEEPDFGAANVAGCNNYIDTLTGLSCWDDAFDPMIDCEATYAGTTTCDISEYFDCIAATYECDASGTLAVDAAAAGECASLATCD